MNYAYDLMDVIQSSPSCFHATENFRRTLLEGGYTELNEFEDWALVPGGKYFVTRNGSSLLAFRLPENKPVSFLMAAAHSDSPTFKIKERPERAGAHYVQLSTERYGGMIMSSWFDRPLSVAGRVVLREGGKLVTRLVRLDDLTLIIPNVAIHMNRAANDGMKYQANVDTLPLFGSEAAKGSFMSRVAAAAECEEKDILSTDLFLYVRDRGEIAGADGDYISAPKLDDLECAFALTRGFLEADCTSRSIPVLCIFDNEEVGSSTKQGAASTFLRDVLRRITQAMGCTESEHQKMLAQSFLISADNAHAQHPNHPEYADADNCPYMNEGIVIKYNANQRYSTDAVSAAIFRSVCEEAGVPVQVFANRSDLAGGSTLGSIASTEVPVSTVDIGLAQLAMHSAYETAGVKDLEFMVRALACYYGKTLIRTAEGWELQ